MRLDDTLVIMCDTSLNSYQVSKGCVNNYWKLFIMLQCTGECAYISTQLHLGIVQSEIYLCIPYL